MFLFYNKNPISDVSHTFIFYPHYSPHPTIQFTEGSFFKEIPSIHVHKSSKIYIKCTRSSHPNLFDIEYFLLKVVAFESSRCVGAIFAK